MAGSHPGGTSRGGRAFVFEVISVELLLIVALVAAFEFAAVRWGYDSRDGFRHIRRH